MERWRKADRTTLRARLAGAGDADLHGVVAELRTAVVRRLGLEPETVPVVAPTARSEPLHTPATTLPEATIPDRSAGELFTQWKAQPREAPPTGTPPPPAPRAARRTTTPDRSAWELLTEREGNESASERPGEMPVSKDFYVVPIGRSWVIHLEGRNLERHPDLDDALARARELASASEPSRVTVLQPRESDADEVDDPSATA